MNVIVLRGIPGSGKSTYIEKITSNNMYVVSADSYFVRDGRYEFDFRKLGLAHAECLRNYNYVIQDHTEKELLLVVDNTNITVDQLAPYAALAQAYSHDLSIITLISPPEICAKRNVHGVSLKSCKNMHKKLIEHNELIPDYWQHVIIDSR